MVEPADLRQARVIKSERERDENLHRLRRLHAQADIDPAARVINFDAEKKTAIKAKTPAAKAAGETHSIAGNGIHASAAIATNPMPPHINC